MSHALDGIRVIDVAINYAGPATSMYLADQGAEVIKIERRITGDTSRRSGNTPFLQMNSKHFMAINRGKRSITLDITKPEGQEVVRELARRADVFVENFRPGVMDRLGIGYTALSALNPRLIYASLTAYGPKGPYADKAGFDRLVQGMSGAMSRRDAEGRPQSAGVWIADWGAPILMAYGIATALLARERTGVGQRVESSLLEAALALQFGDLTLVEEDPAPSREETGGYNAYTCADGVFLNIGAYLPHQWKRLCEVVNLPALAEDSRMTPEKGQALEKVFATRPSKEWVDLLEQADVPCAPIVPRAEVPYHEQILANDMIVPVEHPVVGRTRIMGTPVHLSEMPPVALEPAPTLGQHTDEILTELGYSPERIAELRESEVI